MSLVPYVGGLALRGQAARASLSPLQYAAAASKIARFAYNAWRARRPRGRVSRGRKRMATPMTRSSRPNKKKKLFSRTKIGERIGTTAAKTIIINNFMESSQSSRTLYSQDLTAITQGTNPFNRLRSQVNLRGFRICFQVRSAAIVPQYFNYAVIAPKDDGGTGSIPLNNFFRNNTGDRSVDFSNLLTGLEMQCLAINTDDYTILWHKRFVLNLPNNGASATNQREIGSSWIHFKKWIPLKRQVRWNSPEASIATDGRVFAVYWSSSIGATSGQAGVAGDIRTSSRIVTYFREPEH